MKKWEMESINIFISGDFYGGSQSGSRVEGRFEAGEYREVFGEMAEIIRDCDIAITNLEAPIVDSGTPLNKTGPVLKSSTATLKALKFAGFNTLTLSNNHILDYGLSGLKSTISHLNNADLDHLGASPDPQALRKPLVKELQGRKIAFLNFSENEWSTATAEGNGANPLNPVTNHYDIKKAREKNDFVIVILHGGNEYYDLPTPRIKELCRFYADSGADLVVCHHAHWYSGYEDYKGSRIHYGLGNFLFDVPGKKGTPWNLGMALRMQIHQDGRIVHEMIPYKQCQDFPAIELLHEEEKKDFHNNIARLNAIIRDDEELKSSYTSFIKRKQVQYESFLQPYSGKFRSLYKKKLLPSVLSDNYFLLLLNLIRCESHRDVITDILLKKSFKEHPDKS